MNEIFLLKLCCSTNKNCIILWGGRTQKIPGKFPGIFCCYAASFILSFTMFVILATNSPLVGLPFSGLTVLPK